ncbi:ubiquitin carboxyl-terminal hydrolase 27-like [Vicia villosa]|uniref:ubiquitin carboxyl-terminal hydrolase 27-like n=1 Tax=Vicia villosa TaxID=3911 RepID=UPI00273B267A|nr:ubiquitin carboxyl-terminal hydrolase 27-like [Vicia villosa]
MKKTLWFRQTHTTLTLSPTIRAAVTGIATIAAVGIIFVLKDTKSSKPIASLVQSNNASEKPLSIPGLQNLGNNCFLNVVLQALASCVCFQSFLDSVLAEYENDEPLGENMPLVFSLDSLLQELSSVSTENVVLSPTNLMRAMSSYIPDFDLTSQQDAAEAFVHLLCSLREESGGCYAPKISSLADIFASNNRILTPIQTDRQSEPERWHRLYLGPFDGILCSSLTCQSCSSQISNKFENFDCLPLSPVLSNSYTIRVGCTLMDCLKQFIVAEHIENYHCNHCWHKAAIKYLSLMEGDKVELGKLSRCSDQEFCDCQKTYNLENLPWSNRFTHALKQLNIARCPRVLCIQLKRAHMIDLGESFKLQGHISFPLILDMSSFMTTRLGVNIQENVQSPPLNMQYNKKSSLPNHSNVHSEIRMIKSSGIYGEAKEQIDADTLIGDADTLSSRQELDELPCSSSSESLHSKSQLQSIDKVDVACSSVSQDTCLYQLVSVVEHFGKTGGGHYSVYRCVRSESSVVSGNCFNQNSMHWFRVSDSHVDAVSVDEVLSAEASLLFYERIPNN